ncbi:MAG TPA: AsmA family protein [Xanthobacteraceae bacterium]|nr:AsmA family protein [Xanthobacteraceae bacterium]
MPTATGIKRFGFALGILVVLCIGAIALSSFLISAETARDAVTRQIKAATGFEPEVRGPVTISIFPPDSVSLTDVVLGDDRNRPALAAQNITARLRLLSLLVGKIEIADIVLVRPRIAVKVERGAQQSNWSSLVDTLGRTLKPSAERADLSFSEIRIADGTIVIDNPDYGIKEVLNHVDMSLAWPSISKSFGATGQFAWRSEVVEANLSVTDFYGALTGETSGLKFRLSGAPGKVAFEGTLNNKPTLKIDGMIGADISRLRDMLRWAGKQPPAGNGFNKFALKASLKADNGNFALSSVHVDLDGNAAEGVMSYAFGPRRSLKGTLAAENINLTPYVSAFHLVAGNTRDWNRAPISLEGIADTDLDLRVSAAQIDIAGTKLGRTAIAANMRNGNLNITVGESTAFGGLITGSIAVARSKEGGADVKSQMQFANVDLTSSLNQLFGTRRIEGKGTIAFAVEGSGTTVDAITRTINGTARLNATDGALTGVNVEQLLRRLERRPLSGSGDLRSGRTPFDKLTVNVKITDGIATVDDARLDSAAVKLAVNGTSSIPARDFDLRGTAALVAPNEAGFELPFVVHGPWDDAIILPDPQSLIRRSGAAQPLLDAVRERKARDAVRSAIERLTGSRDKEATGSSQP